MRGLEAVRYLSRIAVDQVEMVRNQTPWPEIPGIESRGVPCQDIAPIYQSQILESNMTWYYLSPL